MFIVSTFAAAHTGKRVRRTESKEAKEQEDGDRPLCLFLSALLVTASLAKVNEYVGRKKTYHEYSLRCVCPDVAVPFLREVTQHVWIKPADAVVCV